MIDINIVDQEVVIEVRTHEDDAGTGEPWTHGPLEAGRITWGVARNARWSALINENG